MARRDRSSGAWFSCTWPGIQVAAFAATLGCHSGLRVASPPVDAAEGGKLDGDADQGGQVGGGVTGPSLQLLAGGLGGYGFRDGIGADARFWGLQSVASDAAGILFAAEACAVRRVVIATGEVTTLAGSPEECSSENGTGSSARFGSAISITSDGAGNLFVGEAYGSIRKVVIATGEVTTIARLPGWDDSGRGAKFGSAGAIVADGRGSLFVTDQGNCRVLKVVIATGELIDLAGLRGVCGSKDGIATAARFFYPAGMASDGAGNLFVADEGDFTLRKVVIATGEVTTLAGSPGASGSDDGIGTAARFSAPYGVASDGAGNLYVADNGNSTLRKVVIATREVTTLVGTAGREGSDDGSGADARFSHPLGVAADGGGNLFVTDGDRCTIRRVAIAQRAVTTLAGLPERPGSTDGVGGAARFFHPAELARVGTDLFVADADNHTIRRIVIATGEVTTLAGSPGSPGTADGIGSAARLMFPRSIVSDDRESLFFTDACNRTIRKVVIATGEVATLAGRPPDAGVCNDPGTLYGTPAGLATDGEGNLFAAFPSSNAIAKIDVATGEQTILAGSAIQGSADGIGVAARFDAPGALAFDGQGNLYVSDSRGGSLRKVVVATGEVVTLARTLEATRDGGIAMAERSLDIAALTADRAGNLFLANEYPPRVQKIDLATGAANTLVGQPSRYPTGVVLGPLPGRLTRPGGLAVGADGELFVTDMYENGVLVARF